MSAATVHAQRGASKLPAGSTLLHQGAARKHIMDTLLREEEVGRAIIREALARVPERILIVPYDELEWLREHHWARIAAHVGIDHVPSAGRLPVFKSGNRRWLKGHHVSDLWALSPPLRNLSGEASLSQADLQHMAAALNGSTLRDASKGRSPSGWTLGSLLALVLGIMAALAVAYTLFTSWQRTWEARRSAQRQELEARGTSILLDRRTGSGHVGVTLTRGEARGGQPGVEVDMLHPNDLAWAGGIRKGDVILSVNGTPVDEPAEAVRAIERSVGQGAVLELMVVPASVELPARKM